VLVYQGGTPPRFVPSRDLEAVDLARAAYRRAAREVRVGRGLRRPGEELAQPTRAAQPDSEAIAAIAEELVASGTFAWTPSTTPNPTPPDAPAEPEA
jgi:hypothetical protein